MVTPPELATPTATATTKALASMTPPSTKVVTFTTFNISKQYAQQKSMGKKGGQQADCNRSDSTDSIRRRTFQDVSSKTTTDGLLHTTRRDDLLVDTTHSRQKDV
jgi:hypothetical protein